jgi:hypothetical protein
MDSIKRFLWLCGILVGIGIAVIAYVKLSQFSLEAQGLALGIVGGCLIGLVPLAILSLFALVVARVVVQNRQMQQRPYQQPPVVVITPNGQMSNPYGTSRYPEPWPPALPGTGTRRAFRTIGEEILEQ